MAPILLCGRCQLFVYTGVYLARRAKSVPKKKAVVVAGTLPGEPDARPKRIVVSNLPRDENGKITAPKKVEPDSKARDNPRQAVLDAFGRIGGVRWLVKYSKRDPKGFAGLLAKAMPTEVALSGTVGYAAMPIPVEVREPIPGEFTVISEAVAAAVPELDPFT